jgi:hypothetical protein
MQSVIHTECHILALYAECHIRALYAECHKKPFSSAFSAVSKTSQFDWH